MRACFFICVKQTEHVEENFANITLQVHESGETPLISEEHRTKFGVHCGESANILSQPLHDALGQSRLFSAKISTRLVGDEVIVN